MNAPIAHFNGELKTVARVRTDVAARTRQSGDETDLDGFLGESNGCHRRRKCDLQS